MHIITWLLLSACSEYDLQEKPDNNAGFDSDMPLMDTAMPADCSVELPAMSSVPIDKECVAPELSIENPWSVALEWSWRGMETAPDVQQVMMLPAVGNLTDDDGDGESEVFDRVQ